MADLSKLSNEDLIALKSGDVTKVSDQGLLHLSGKAQAMPAQSAPVEAAVAGFGDAAALGYGAQLQAGTEVLSDKVAKALGIGQYAQDAALGAQGFKIEQQDPTYVQARDQAIARQNQLQAQNPSAYGAGQVGGLVTSALALPGGGATRGLSTGQKIVRGGITGGALGAIQNPGDIKGEVSPLQLGERTESAGIGALMGGALEPVAQSVGYLAGKGKDLVKKVASETSGLTETTINTYADRAKKVNQIIKETKGDISSKSDELRTKLSSEIQRKKAELGGKIGAELKSMGDAKVVEAKPILEKLSVWKDKLDPVYDAEKIGQIDELIQTIGKKAPDGLFSAQELNATKNFLQENAQSAYQKGGQIFIRAKEAARAAKDAAFEARRMLNEIAPETRAANSVLAKLHNLDSNLNKNLLKAGGSDSALLAAGSGANKRNANMLRLLEGASGVPVLTEAENLAAAKAFGDPSFTSMFPTGRAALGAIGGSLGGYASGDTSSGALVGAALSSPAVIKKVIQGRNLVAPLAKGTVGLVGQNPERSQFILNRLRALNHGE